MRPAGEQPAALCPTSIYDDKPHWLRIVLRASYGINGVNYFDFGSSANETVDGMALDPINRMVIVGTAGNVFAVARVSTGQVLK
jgi:hypothetical protein